MKKIAVSLMVTLLASFLSSPALAYNSSTHSRIAEMAVITMQQLPPIVFPPNDFTDEQKAQFELYVAQLRAAPGKLEGLRSGLPLASDPEITLAFTPAAGAPTERYPFQDFDSSRNCVYFDDQNLDIIHKFRISDLNHIPRRVGDACGVRATRTASEVLPKVMGFHAQDVDDHLTDTVIWIRPTAIATPTWINEVSTRAGDLLIASLVLPFVCIYNLIDSGECDPEDAQDIALQVNPQRYLSGLIPGVGYSRSTDYMGLWHYLDVAGSTHRYNDIRGMFYEEAGPSYPGVIDVGVMILADSAGLSLNAGASQGDDRYGENDRVSRGDLVWQSTTIGHLEFSPIDNLAKYGWDRYKNGGHTDAAGLAYVLHALGDMCEPHHVTGTTSWGHRPYEDFTGTHNEELLRFADQAQRDRILIAGFSYWSSFHDDEDVRQLVTRVGFETYDDVIDSDWAFKDGASLEYVIGARGPEGAREQYIGTEAHIEPLLERSAAATLAFLAVAGDRAQDPGKDGSITCATNTHYEPTRGCQPGPSVNPGPPTLVLTGVCPANTSCGTGTGGTTGMGCTPACGPTVPCAPRERCESDGCCRAEVN